MISAQLHTEFLPYPDKEDRKVMVYVPSHEEGELLPVIYMTDGQNLFDESATPYGCWDVIKAVEDEQKNGSAGAIIVGIDNGNKYRDCELTPKCIGEVQYKELMSGYVSSEGEIFDGFLKNTVIPYVEGNYPVKSERKFTSVCGSSSGGLQAFFTGIEHSDRFACVGAFSPAFLIYTRDDWRKYLISKIKDNVPYLYIYTGDNDLLEHMIFKSVEMMYDLLPEVGYPLDMMNEVVLFENKHNENAWRDIFKDFLHTFLNSI